MPNIPPVQLRGPLVAGAPIVIDSPHSGITWPSDFAPTAPRTSILTTWDAFVDELWSEAPAAGASLLSARFPRAYVDVNRAADDIDPVLALTTLLAPRPGVLPIVIVELPDLAGFDALLGAQA